MDEDLWIERWPAENGKGGRLASASDRRVIGAAWRMAQLLGLGPKLLLRDRHQIIESWEPVHFTGKR